MDFRVYLQNHQPFVYKTFINAIKQNKIAQTYMIKGNEGAPILEVAMFLAKTLICEVEDDLACSSCLSCIRFDERNYADFMLLDGSKQTLKVGDIEKLQEFLSSSCMEKKGKKIYIINCLENSNKETLNALLKTLEEPFENVYAFITTQNESKLPLTILSRCQILNLIPSERTNIKEEVLEQGVSIDDTEILSSLYNNVETIMNNLDNENYKVCKECLFDTLDSLEQSPLKALLYVQSELINKIKTKEQARLYLDLLAIAFKDILLAQLEQDIILEIYKKTIATIAKKIKGIEKIYLEIMLSRGKIESNISISLLLEHIFIQLIQGGNGNGN